MTPWCAQIAQVSSWCELEGGCAEDNSKVVVPGALVGGDEILQAGSRIGKHTSFYSTV